MKRIIAILLSLWGTVASAAEIALVPGQIYDTGNIVVPTTSTSGSTWTNGVYQDSLTCWGWGMPGYCGPNPIVGPSGTINYSFGWTDLYQQQSLATVLPNSGTGLRVDGYNFNFMAKNGNGWDDGRTDLLFAYVQFDGPKGTVLNNTTNLSYQFDWTRINLTQTFATPYSTSEVTSVRYGFVGQDNNFWAGPYGPEIYDVNFSLKYSVDPCTTNPLSSPNCPGFLAAMATLTTSPIISDPVPVPETTVISAPTQTTIVSASIAPMPVSSPIQERTPTLISPRLLSIVRSINELTAATVTATVTQSIEQSQSAAATQDLALAATPSAAANRGSAATANTESDAGAGSLTRPGDPVAAARSGRTQTVQEDAREEPKSNRSAPPPPAELAGGISVAALAQGADLTSYAALALRDAQFYAPREIYRGQRVIDNARVLRGLGSDARHAEMVDQQYRK